MRRIFTTILPFILLVTICFSFSSCVKANNDGSGPDPYFYGAIIYVDDKEIIVCPHDDMKDSPSTDLVSIPRTSIDGLIEGNVLCITYDGSVNTTYPATLNNIKSVEVYEGEDLGFNSDILMASRNHFCETKIDKKYPFGEDAFDAFLSDIENEVPSKYATYTYTIEGDPMIFYYDFVVDEKIGNYFIQGYDSSMDKWAAYHGITYYKYPYIFEGENGGICIGNSKDLEAYDSVINYDSGECSYVFYEIIGVGNLEGRKEPDNRIPVVHINNSATATVGLDTVNHPNIIYVNNNGDKTEIDFGDNDGYLARGVYFSADDSFVVVCENSSREDDYLIREYEIKDSNVVEGKTYNSEMLPSPW